MDINLSIQKQYLVPIKNHCELEINFKNDFFVTFKIIFKCHLLNTTTFVSAHSHSFRDDLVWCPRDMICPVIKYYVDI